MFHIIYLSIIGILLVFLLLGYGAHRQLAFKNARLIGEAYQFSEFNKQTIEQLKIDYNQYAEEVIEKYEDKDIKHEDKYLLKIILLKTR